MFATVVKKITHKTSIQLQRSVIRPAQFNTTIQPKQHFPVFPKTTPFKRYIVPFAPLTPQIASLHSGLKNDPKNNETNDGPSNMQFLKHVWNHGSAASADSQWDESQGTIYQFKDSMNDIDGNPFNFETLKGKAVIITNVACDCGFTKSGYEHIVQWQKEFAGKPFEVVAFPSNAFNQEKKSAEEIKEHVKTTFGFEKILMEKSHINGEKTNPVYTWLKKSFPGDITWNFSSWMLVDHRGIPIQRFEKESWDEIKASLDAAVTNAMKAEAEAEEEKKE